MCRDVIWYWCGTGRWFRVCVTDTHCHRSWSSIEGLYTNIFSEWEVLVVMVVVMCSVLTAYMFCSVSFSILQSPAPENSFSLLLSLYLSFCLSFCFSLSVFLCLSVSLWLSVCLPLSPSVWLSVALDCLLGLSPSACLSVSVMNADCGSGLSFYMVRLHQSVCLVSLSVWLSVALDCLSSWSVSISLSVCVFVSLVVCGSGLCFLGLSLPVSLWLFPSVWFSGCLWLWTVCLHGLSPSVCLSCFSVGLVVCGCGLSVSHGLSSSACLSVGVLYICILCLSLSAHPHLSLSVCLPLSSCLHCLFPMSYTICQPVGHLSELQSLFLFQY